MTHFKWLKKEIPRWVKEEIITREAGDSLISLYRNEQRHSHGEGLFVLAAVCFLTGLIFICAGVWNGLSQDEQFMMALVPLVLSILIIAAILWQDRPVMDQIPAESVRLEEAENTAELLSGETGGTVSAGSGSEENTAAGNKGKDLSSLLPSVSYRHRVPDVIREAAGVFHGVAVLCAVWMVNESFKLSGDWFVLAAVSCVFLLLMSWAFPTAGLGMVYMASSVLKFVVSSKTDLEDMKEIIIKYFPRGGPKFYVSPVWGKIEPRELVEYVRKEKLAEVCVQVQLHKIIWEPDRRGV